MVEIYIVQVILVYNGVHVNNILTNIQNMVMLTNVRQLLLDKVGRHHKHKKQKTMQLTKTKPQIIVVILTILPTITAEQPLISPKLMKAHLAVLATRSFALMVVVFANYDQLEMRHMTHLNNAQKRRESHCQPTSQRKCQLVHYMYNLTKSKLAGPIKYFKILTYIQC